MIVVCPATIICGGKIVRKRIKISPKPKDSMSKYTILPQLEDQPIGVCLFYQSLGVISTDSGLCIRCHVQHERVILARNVL